MTLPATPPIPTRRARPRERPSNLLLLGALLGGALATDKAAGAFIGGALGGLATKEQPVTLERALRDGFSAVGANLISMYRHGPMHVRVLYNYKGQFWTIDSIAPFMGSQDDLDDWLFGDLVDHQLVSQLNQLNGGRP